MTIICCLPSLPVEVFWYLLTPLRRYYLRLRYASRRAASTRCRLGSRAQAIDYALTGACFHAGEIRVLDSSLCTKLSCIGKRDDSWVARSSFRNAFDRCGARQESGLAHFCSRGRRPRVPLKIQSKSALRLLTLLLDLCVFGSQQI
jgi:hypothetical protein